MVYSSIMNNSSPTKKKELKCSMTGEWIVFIQWNDTVQEKTVNSSKKKLYKLTYLQNRNKLSKLENELMATGERGGWRKG